jgi:hypothetical protein
VQIALELPDRDQDVDQHSPPMAFYLSSNLVVKGGSGHRPFLLDPAQPARSIYGDQPSADTSWRIC